MKKQKIAFDIDDVIANSTESFRLHVNKVYGVELTREHYSVPGDYWKYCQTVWQSNGLGDKISLEELSKQMVTDQSHIKPFGEAGRILKDLSTRYELIVITARDASWEQMTVQWVNQHFPDTFSTVAFAGQHNNIAQTTKGDLCAKVGARWLIDDNVVHCTSATDRGVEAILFGEYGWQQDVPNSLIRCKNWSAVGKHFAVG